jgi:hypothetical protein
MSKLRNATTSDRYQLTTDGFRPYIEAVENVLPSYIAFAQLVKVGATLREGEQRYAPGNIVDAIPNTRQPEPRSHLNIARTASESKTFVQNSTAAAERNRRALGEVL